MYWQVHLIHLFVLSHTTSLLSFSILPVICSLRKVATSTCISLVSKSLIYIFKYTKSLTEQRNVCNNCTRYLHYPGIHTSSCFYSITLHTLIQTDSLHIKLLFMNKCEIFGQKCTHISDITEKRKFCIYTCIMATTIIMRFFMWAKNEQYFKPNVPTYARQPNICKWNSLLIIFRRIRLTNCIMQINLTFKVTSCMMQFYPHNIL